MHNKIRIIKRMPKGILNYGPERKRNFGMTMKKLRYERELPITHKTNCHDYVAVATAAAADDDDDDNGDDATC
jgi:hypothetical protein